MDFGIESSRGHVRSMNQDVADVFTNKAKIKMALLCDGMGGHNAGDVASEMALKQLGHAFENSNVDTVSTISEWLNDHIEQENQRIFDKSVKFSDFEGMGTTVVAAVFIQDKALIANVGDSRAYHYQQGELTQVTSDHSFVNELVKNGELSEEEAETHPKRHILVSALGSTSPVTIDFYEVDMKHDDYILLTSDGMHQYFTEQNVYSILEENESAQKKASAFVKMGLSEPADDNLTICVCHNNGKES